MAGTDAAIVAELSTGTDVTIVDGPVEADGVTWYQVETTGQGAGWVAGEYLASVSG